MNKCDGCGTEFDDSVDLFPRLVITKEAQVARKLSEREDEEDMLCLGCWLDAVDGLEKKQLAMILLGMLRKVNNLESELATRWNRTRSEIIEKWAKMPKSSPTITSPNTGPIWVSPPSYDDHYVGDRPDRYHTTTSCKCTGQTTAVPGQDMYVWGSWAEKVH